MLKYENADHLRSSLFILWPKHIISNSCCFAEQDVGASKPKSSLQMAGQEIWFDIHKGKSRGAWEENMKW